MPGETVAGAPVPRQRTDVARYARVSAGPALDRLADLACRLLGTGSAQVSLLTDVQTVAGGAGLPPGTVGAASPLEHSLCHVTAGRGMPLTVADAPADSRVNTLPPVTGGAVGAYLGVPLVTSRGQTVGALCVFDAAPRSWDDAAVELLSSLAGSVVAELELAALSGEYQRTVDRWELAIDAAGVGSFDLDVRTGELLWDTRLLTLFGYRPDEFGRTIEDFNARVHPDDLTRVTATLEHAVTSCGTLDVEYRIVLPDTRVRWIASRGRAVAGDDGATERLLGAAYDTTDVHEGEARIARVLESMSAGFCALDAQWQVTYVNGEAERLLGRPREELLGGSIWELFPATMGSEHEQNYRAAVDTGRAVTFEAYCPAPLERWYELRAWPSPDGLSIYFLDVTDRRAAQQQAVDSARRAQLVADVTSELSATLDSEEAVARLAQLLVPELADWCLVTLVDDDGGLRDVGWAHRDPARQQLVARYAAVRVPALTSASFVAQAVRTRRPALVTSDATARISSVLIPGEARDLLLELAPESGAIFPLQARGRTVGLLSLFGGPDRGPYTGELMTTARDVAARAALALDNARLFQEQRQLAEALQRSLLTPPPEPDHMQLAVRYTPAAQAAQVGGDWYDAFLQPDGATVLVIGDVVGHDTAAAAAMGQVRGLLRGIAFTTQTGPAEVLSRLDAAMEGLQVGTNATAVVARLEQTPDEQARGVTRLRWSNAGHPPPMVVDDQARVQLLEADEADLLLGIDPSSPRNETTVTLERGATVLLYTDGLVERRGQSLDEGLERLRALLSELAHLPLEELCDALLARLLPRSSDDDVALVAVRLHRQDRPRPAEAGPRSLPPEVPPEPR